MRTKNQMTTKIITVQDKLRAPIQLKLLLSVRI